jgi:hypothetical protein
LIGLSCHGTLIAGNINAIKQYAVSRNLHSLLYLDDVTGDKLRDVESASQALGPSEDSAVLNIS